MLAAIAERFGVELRYSHFAADPTVAGMAARVERAVRARRDRPDRGAAAAQVEADPAGAHQPFPLTDVQEAYFVGQNEMFALAGVSPHAYLEFDIDQIDLDRLVRAWQAVIARHSMLRAVIRADGQQCVLAQPPAYRPAVEDLRGAADPSGRLAEIRQQLSHQRFDPQKWPLFDLRISLMAGGRGRLHVSYDFSGIDYLSLQIVLRELERLYLEPDARLPDIDISFRDYVLWEAAQRHTVQYRIAARYWKARLDSLPMGPDLPLEVRPAEVSRPRVVRHQASLAPARWQALKQHAAARGLTPSGVLLTAFADVLRVWSRRPSFTLNLPVFNRAPVHPQVGALVGDFTSLLLLEVAAPAVADSFADRALALQSQLWRDFDHRDFSGVQFLRELARVSDDRRGATMPVVFTSLLPLDTDPTGDRAAAGRLFDQAGFTLTQTPQVWIDHQVRERGGSLLFNWDVVEELFPTGMIGDMFAAFCARLEGLEHEDAWAQSWREAAFEIVPRQQLEVRRAVNHTEAPVSDACLQQLFHRAAEASPGQVAMIAPERRLSYGEVAARADAVADALAGLALEPGELVGVVMSKGWEQVVAALGVLEAGAAYVPIDAALPAERRRYLFEVTGLRAVVTQPRWDRELDWPPAIQRTVGGPEPTAPRAPRDRAPAQSPDDVAYVIFTSGSTGQPKGVVIATAARSTPSSTSTAASASGPDDRVFGISSFSFDSSVYDVFGTLAAGGSLVLPESRGAPDPDHWLRPCRAAPGHGMELGPGSARAGHRPGRGRRAAAAGRPAPGPAQRRLDPLDPAPAGGRAGARRPGHEPGRRDRGLDLVDHLSHRASRSQLEQHPLRHPAGQPVVRGARPAHDARDRCGPPAISTSAGWAWRRATGGSRQDRAQLRRAPGDRRAPVLDRRLGRYLPDGTIEFLGREDSQVKVQGFRIELGEIEAALRRHPAISDAVATVQGERMGHKRLVAYIVSRWAVDWRRGELRVPVAGRADIELEGVPRVGAAVVDLSADGVGLGELAAPLPVGARVRLRCALAGAALDLMATVEWSAGARAGVHVEPGLDHAALVDTVSDSGARAGRLPHGPAHHPRAHPGEGPLSRGRGRQPHLAGVAVRPLGRRLRRGRSARSGAGHPGMLTLPLPPDGELIEVRGRVRWCHGGRTGVQFDDDQIRVRSMIAVPDPGDGTGPVHPGRLPSFLEHKLPDYMIPSAFVPLNRLPLTQNGKVDRAALPSLQQSRQKKPRRQLGSRQPGSEREQALVDMLGASCFKVDDIGPDDNFFDLGGDSILALQVVARAGDLGLRTGPAAIRRPDHQRPPAGGRGHARRWRRGRRRVGSGAAASRPGAVFEQGLLNPHLRTDGHLLESAAPLDPDCMCGRRCASCCRTTTRCAAATCGWRRRGASASWSRSWGRRSTCTMPRPWTRRVRRR